MRARERSVWRKVHVPQRARGYSATCDLLLYGRVCAFKWIDINELRGVSRAICPSALDLYESGAGLRARADSPAGVRLTVPARECLDS